MKKVGKLIAFRACGDDPSSGEKLTDLCVPENKRKRAADTCAVRGPSNPSADLPLKTQDA